MSGGHYDYAPFRVRDLAEAIRTDCETWSKCWVDQWGDTHEPLPEDILGFMARTAERLEEAAQAAHDIEWFMSGDTGEDTLRGCKSFDWDKA